MSKQKQNKSQGKRFENNKFENNRRDSKKEYSRENKREVRREHPIEEREDLVIGRNAVMELLKTDRTIEFIYVAKGDNEGSIKKILTIAKEKKVVIKEAEKKKLDSMCDGAIHQGIVAKVTEFKYCEVADILRVAKEKNEAPFIVILDELEDPHNLGSIIRTAELCGVHGIIIPKRRNVGITSTVYKCAVGAVEYMNVAKVTNINAAIDELKEAGVWVYGADIDGVEYSFETDFGGACAIVIGNEGRGISNLTLKKCDKVIKIPMIGKINSLNASVAGGIMMYEVLKGRLKEK